MDPTGGDPIPRVVQIQILEGRRLASDNAMWQVVALGLAAQSLLLTVAYAATSTGLARVGGSALAAVVGYGALNQFLRHRQAEELLNHVIEGVSGLVDEDMPAIPSWTALERSHGGPGGAFSGSIRTAGGTRPRDKRAWPKSAFASPFIRPTRHVWTLGLGAFLVFDIAAVIFAILDAATST
jgi:hypothetical protein